MSATGAFLLMLGLGGACQPAFGAKDSQQMLFSGATTQEPHGHLLFSGTTTEIPTGRPIFSGTTTEVPTLQPNIASTFAVCDKKDIQANRPPPPKELRKKIDAHKKWLASHEPSLKRLWEGKEFSAYDQYLQDAREEVQFANFEGKSLSGLWLAHVDLRWADLRGANFRDADLFNANLAHADLSAAKSGGRTKITDLSNVDLTCADLRDVNAERANMKDATLLHTNMKGANVSFVRFHRALFEPIQGGVPDARYFTFDAGLETMGFNFDHGMVELREALKRGGFRDRARQVDYAIRTENNRKVRAGEALGDESEVSLPRRVFHKLGVWVQLVFLEWTCGYGLYPFRIVPWVAVVGLLFVLSYWLMLVTGRGELNIGEAKLNKESSKAQIFWKSLFLSFVATVDLPARALRAGPRLREWRPKGEEITLSGGLRLLAGIQSAMGAYAFALFILTFFDPIFRW